jgi:hypothetical protein
VRQARPSFSDEDMVERNGAQSILRPIPNKAARLPRKRDSNAARVELERETGFEPATSTLARSRSTK